MLRYFTTILKRRDAIKQLKAFNVFLKSMILTGVPMLLPSNAKDHRKVPGTQKVKSPGVSYWPNLAGIPGGDQGFWEA